MEDGGSYWGGNINEEHGYGGAGGKLTGINSSNGSGGKPDSTGGTQISGGTHGGDSTGGSGTFGIGGSSYYGSAGGGGYYGGGGQGRSHAGGAGGSSYISGHEGCIAIDENGRAKVTVYNEFKDSVHYSGRYFTQTEMKAGNEKMPTKDESGTMIGNDDNGFCKISYVE